MERTYANIYLSESSKHGEVTIWVCSGLDFPLSHTTFTKDKSNCLAMRKRGGGGRRGERSADLIVKFFCKF